MMVELTEVFLFLRDFKVFFLCYEANHMTKYVSSLVYFTNKSFSMSSKKKPVTFQGASVGLLFYQTGPVS